jgi:hypothetical protein
LDLPGIKFKGTDRKEGSGLSGNKGITIPKPTQVGWDLINLLGYSKSSKRNLANRKTTVI